MVFCFINPNKSKLHSLANGEYTFIFLLVGVSTIITLVSIYLLNKVFIYFQFILILF